jgi:hypothetical protein
LRSRENDARDMGFIELQQPVRLPSPSSPIPRRHDRSEPPLQRCSSFRGPLFQRRVQPRGAQPRGGPASRGQVSSVALPRTAPHSSKMAGVEDLDVRCSMLVLPWSMQRSRIVRVRQPEEIGSRRRRRADCRRSGSSRLDQLTRCRSRGRCGAHTLEDRGARSGEERTPTRVWPILGRLQFRGGED